MVESSSSTTSSSGNNAVKNNTKTLPHLPPELVNKIFEDIPKSSFGSLSRAFEDYDNHQLREEARRHPHELILDENATEIIESLLFFPNSPLAKTVPDSSDPSFTAVAPSNSDTGPHSAVSTHFSFDSLPTEQKDQFVAAVIEQKEDFRSMWSILHNCAWIDIRDGAPLDALRSLKNLSESYKLWGLGDMFPGLEYRESVNLDWCEPGSERRTLLAELKLSLLPEGASRRHISEWERYYPDQSEDDAMQDFIHIKAFTEGGEDSEFEFDWTL